MEYIFINIKDGIYDEFVMKAAKLAEQRAVGDPWTDVDQGPQVTLSKRKQLKNPKTIMFLNFF